MKSVRMVRPDVMKEDGWHQKIPFTDPANIQKQEIALKMKSVRIIRPDVLSRGGRWVLSPTAGVARLEKVQV